jgi:hypothetical protein
MTSPSPGGPSTATKRPADGAAAEPEVFRLGAPVVIWWIWLVFAAGNLVDLAIQAQPRFAVVVSAILVMITGVAYACGFRPRVTADDTGITVVNPVREFRVPWAAVREVDVRDWVRIHYATAPGTTKKIESWALFATARVKRNYSQRAQAYAAKSAETARMPDEAKRLMTLPAVVVIARRIEARARAEQARGAPAGALSKTWAWQSIATMALPAIALTIVLLT